MSAVLKQSREAKEEALNQLPAFLSVLPIKDYSLTHRYGHKCDWLISAD